MVLLLETIELLPFKGFFVAQDITWETLPQGITGVIQSPLEIDFGLGQIQVVGILDGCFVERTLWLPRIPSFVKIHVFCSVKWHPVASLRSISVDEDVTHFVDIKFIFILDIISYKHSIP